MLNYGDATMKHGQNGAKNTFDHCNQDNYLVNIPELDL
jgi:hypothetical protein